MSDSEYLARWIDLTAYLLAQPFGHDPMLEICDELSAHFRTVSTGTIDYGAKRVRVTLYRPSDGDASPYASRIGDHPLAQHYRATSDPHARAMSEAAPFLDDPRCRAVVDRLRAANLNDFVFLPLAPRAGMQHRWLSLSSDGELGLRVRDELDRVGPLLRAVDAQATALARTFGIPSTRSTPAQSAPAGSLSGREFAVLALVARGLTAVAISTRLGISPRTVSKHQQNIYRKLEVTDRLTAVMRAHSLGILPQHGPVRHAPVTVEVAVGATASQTRAGDDPATQKCVAGLDVAVSVPAQ
ncbi:helix-turn-helix transcriptional regulator [Rhodococcus sp. IEGM 248]|nr:helix-turn-helix transcriptional regulator [Rhodococcus sp. IEGM 248]